MDDLGRRTLLAAGSPAVGETWCDMGCGDGAFAIPLLSSVGASGKLVAIDRDANAIAALRISLTALGNEERFDLRVADVQSPPQLPMLDGVLFANVLHFVADPAAALGNICSSLKSGARILVIEYDRADRNPWVPYPIPASTLGTIARNAGIAPFEVKARVRSDFGRMLYAAVSTHT
ncbi:MAG: methyltransferase domain-containing protein [Gemmatimonadaceae bacterium]